LEKDEGIYEGELAPTIFIFCGQRGPFYFHLAVILPKIFTKLYLLDLTETTKIIYNLFIGEV